MCQIYDSAFNKILNHDNLFEKEGNKILKNVTHVIDCECYRFMGRLFYREVSIFEMDKCSFVSLQCYAEHTPPYHRLHRKSKQKDWRNEFYRSQEELIIFLKKYSGRKNILFGYKGRTI